MKRIIIKVNQGRNYLFSTATKPIQFLNGVLSLFFGIVYLINGSTLNQLKIYLNFSYMGPIWIWWVVIFLGILQLNYMRRDILDSNIKSALVMHTCALMWFVISILFGSDYPPLSTGFFTYFWISVVCSLTALQIDNQNTYELLIRKELEEQ